MTEWPLHITLAGVFAHQHPDIDLGAKLAQLLTKQPSVIAHVVEEAALGLTPVVLLKKRHDLMGLHHRIADLLESHKAAFHTPEFMRDGFLPHCTIQNGQKLPNSGKVHINTVALVDMLPGGDWRRRKVLDTFRLRGRRSPTMQVQTAVKAMLEKLQRPASTPSIG